MPSNGEEIPPVPQVNDEKTLPDVSPFESAEEKDIEAGTLTPPQPPAKRKPSRESVQLATAARMASSSTLWQRLKNKLPAYKKFFGLKRRTFFIVLGVAVAFLLALIIGLSVGLSRRHSK
jgi:hypothetical protein